MKNASFTKLLGLVAVFVLAAWGVNAQATYNGTTGLLPTVGTAGPASFTVNVTETGIIGSDVIIDEIALDIAHTWVGDLDMTLTSPSGTTLNVWNNLIGGGNGDDILCSVDDNAAAAFSSLGGCNGANPPCVIGAFQPNGGAMNTAFAGEQINGTWTIDFVDNVGGDSGEMTAWSLSTQPLSCTITCPADIVVGTDPGVCEAFVSVPDPVTDGCAGAFGGEVTLNSGQVNLNGTTQLLATNVTITGAMANAISPVSFSMTVGGDFDIAGTENAVLVGPDGVTYFNVDTQGQCTAETFTISISAADWNNLVTTFGANLTFTLQANTAVNPGTLCTTDFIELEATYFTSFIDFVNNFNGGQNASGVYPLGTTEVTYSTTDANGNTVSCSFTVTVEDDEDPVFTACPSNILVNLGPGECGQNISYNVEATDNCLSNNPNVASFQVPNPFLPDQGGSFTYQGGLLPGGNIYDLANVSGQPITIESIDVRFAVAGGPAPGTPAQVSFYTTTTANTFQGVQNDPNAWTLLGGAPIDVLTGPVGATTNVPFPGGGLTLQPGESRGIYMLGSLGLLYNTGGTSTLVPFSNGDLTLTSGLGTGGFGTTLFGPPRTPNVIFNYSVGSGGALALELIEGLESGSFFDKDDSPYTIVWQATDASGNSSLCEFTITVNEFPDAVETLACNDNVQVSLDATGTAVVMADMILEGGPYGCYDDYIVSVDGGDNIVDCSMLGGPWTVMVEDPDTGNKCWGSIIIEDKLDPIIECEDFSINCTQDLDDLVLDVQFAGNSFGQAGSGEFITVGSPINVDIPVAFQSGDAGLPITDVNVVLNVNHTWVGDLDITLTSPSGTSVALMDSQCGTSDNINATFDDDGGILICGVNPAVSGTVQPFGTLADFNGESADGTWSINITDNVGGDDGNLNNVELIISTGALYPAAQASDNCEIVSLTYEDITDNGDCDGDAGTVLRTWTAIDQSGNEATCTQTITILRPTLNSVALPPSLDGVDEDALDCTGAGWDTNGNGYPDVAETGEPTIGGLPFTNGSICNITKTYEDLVIDDICESTWKVRRKWTVIDWCTGDEIEYNQFIKVLDDNGPNVVCPQGPITINVYSSPGTGTGPHDFCLGNVAIPPIQVLGDDCGTVDMAASVTEVWTLGAGELLVSQPGNGGTFTLEIVADNPPSNNAEYTVRHRIYDGCGNVTDCLYDIIVVDQVPPVAICDEITDLSLTNGNPDGCTLLPASDLDDGSYDNCENVWFYAAKMNPFLQPPYFYQYYPALEFCCDEAGTEQMVILLVLDFDPTPFTLPDGSIFLTQGSVFDGSFNTCMVQVNVEDKIPPVVSCPPNATITCEDYLDNYAMPLGAEDYSVLEVFGDPVIFDNCEPIVEYEVDVNVNTCQEGTITRTWTVTDASGNGPFSCTQTIFVEHVSDWVVEFPADITATCEDGELPEFGEPEVFFDECELIGTAFEDVYYYIVPDACYKIVRTWTVINWCVFDDYGYDVYLEENFAEENLFQDWDGDGDFDDRTFRDGWNTSGTPGIADGYITYDQVIKVIDEDDPIFNVEDLDVCIEDSTCDTTVELEIPDVEDCSSITTIVVTSDLPGATGDQYVYNNVPPGEYSVLYTVTDECGNTSYDNITVTVEDCKKPTPYCVNGLVIEIMQTGMIDIWAEDFDAGSFDNCPGDLKLSFSPDVNNNQLIFTCDDLGQQPIELWVTDAAGNQDFCETFVVVQDNMGACSSASAAVSGLIETEGGAGVEDVLVEVNGGLFSQLTSNTGNFGFTLETGNDYSITPMLDADADNGVSTYDIVLITQHILGLNQLNSPYKMIAADANNSQTVTTLDVVEIRKVILQISSSFTNNTSWRFVDAEYVFPVATNPWADFFPEVINYNNLNVDQLNTDFIGIKVGDVNGNATANQLAGADDRTMTGALVLSTKDQALTAGSTYTVEFTAADAEVLGYQFTLNFDKDALSLVEIVEGVASIENFGTTLLEEGAITTSWNTAEARTFGANEVLFSLVFEATADAQLSELLSVGSRFTTAEAYNASSQLMDVELELNGTAAAAGFELYQNVPNPFKGQTLVTFNLPEASSATLKIMDLSGKVLRVIDGEFNAGINTVTLRDLNATGVLYYQLDTPNHSATKKMIIMD